MKTIYGYARASTLDQSTYIQEKALKAAGATLVRCEETPENHNELQNLLMFIRKGETLMVTRIDRLTRSVNELQEIVHLLEQKGAHLKAIEQSIDVGSIEEDAVFVELEANLQYEQQAEGIFKAA